MIIKFKLLSLVTVFGGVLLFLVGCTPAVPESSTRGTIFAYGGVVDVRFGRYIVELTGKPRPKVVYLPTASGDHENEIKYWENLCGRLDIEPRVLKVWIDSETRPEPFENTLLEMDAIVVGGGNTLNMLAIWKAQGIDAILTQALERGIVLAGGSAGSICWFTDGISDSRPVALSRVEGLDMLPFSNCPHYGSPVRKELYHRLLLSGEMEPGYASDDYSGILFRDGKFVEAVSKNENNHSYYVYVKDGAVREEKLESRYLIAPDALSPEQYRTEQIGMSLADYKRAGHEHPIIHVFQGAPNTSESQIYLEKMYIYRDSLAAVVNKIPRYDFYLISLFHRDNDTWKYGGDDIGITPVEAEISFRERAKMHFERMYK